MDVHAKSNKPADGRRSAFDTSMVPFWTYLAGGIGVVAGLLGLLVVITLA